MNHLDSPSLELGSPRSHRHSPWRRGEAQPTPDSVGTRLPLAAGEMCWIEDVGTFTAHCASGSLWITSPDPGCDVCLSANECLEMSTRGKLLVTAMSDSALWLPPGYGLDDEHGPSATRRIVRRRQ